MGMVITGWTSKIAEKLRNKAPDWEVHVKYDFRSGDPFPYTVHQRYVFCQGVLYPKRAEEHSEEEKNEIYNVNFAQIACACDKIIRENPFARICIVGSESGYKGSYNQLYAESKKRIHEYVEQVRLTSEKQQIFAVSPHIISDAGMTTRRTDKSVLEAHKRNNPRGRFITSSEVASLIRHIIYEQPHICNTVIRMNSGNSLVPKSQH